VKRGEIWTVSGGTGYAGKPRPVVIVQDDRFDVTEAITICAFTTREKDSPLFRLRIEPDGQNGLIEPSSLMVDKLTTVSKKRMAKRLGRIGDHDIVRLNRAILVFLGIAG
jgi:mRNA interferase MazF